MNDFNGYILRLPRSRQLYNDEVDFAGSYIDDEGLAYSKYISKISFIYLIEQVIQPCMFYPDDIDVCRDLIDDAAYAILNDNGDYAPPLSIRYEARLLALFHQCANEVMRQLEGAGYHGNRNIMDAFSTSGVELVANIYAVEMNSITYAVRVIFENNSI